MPPGAISVLDAVENSDEGYRWNARVVLPASRLDAFMASCDVQERSLEPAFDVQKSEAFLVRPTPEWWNLPPARFVVGTNTDARLFALVERDTDFAVFLAARGAH